MMGAPDTGNGICLELDLPDRVVPVDGVDQPDDPVTGQVRAVDMLGETNRHTGGYVLHQR